MSLGRKVVRSRCLGNVIGIEMMDRDETLVRIENALRIHSGNAWSVPGNIPIYWHRFWSKVKFGGDNECWVWQRNTVKVKGRPSSSGYGLFKLDGKTRKAHRVSYELVFGAIPNGLQVLHLCDNPPCVNPVHLFVGTNHDNVLDSMKKGRRAIQDPRPADRNGTSDLFWDDIDNIRMRAAAGESQKSIAVSYGIAQSSVSRIVNQEVWRDEHRPK
jgi:hypothetical protein